MQAMRITLVHPDRCDHEYELVDDVDGIAIMVCACCGDRYEDDSEHNPACRCADCDPDQFRDC